MADATPSTNAAASRTPVWEDFIDIFYAPSAVFARRENGKFGVQLALLTLALVLVLFASRGVLQPVMEAEFARQAEAAARANPEITAAQQQQMRTVAQRFQSFSFLLALVMTPLVVFVVGGITWLVGKFFDSRQTLRSAFMVATYAYIPYLLARVVDLVQGMVLDTSEMTSMADLTLGVGRFLDRDAVSPVLFALATRIDLFTIWVTVLLGIGLKVTGKISSARAAAAAAIVWLVGAVPTLMGALRAQ